MNLLKICKFIVLKYNHKHKMIVIMNNININAHLKKIYIF
jgi:hypothetical protein